MLHTQEEIGDGKERSSSGKSKKVHFFFRASKIRLGRSWEESLKLAQIRPNLLPTMQELLYLHDITLLQLL
jgi:hypothetical protein